MANGKKSFILYCDLIHTVAQLPDQHAGKLLKHILSYVNDENPADPYDLVLNVAWQPIKHQLKRDLKKWEGYIEKQRENGAKGGRPPKPNPKKGEPKKPKPLSENPPQPKKADSVTVSVSDSVNGIVNVNETKKEKGVALPFLDNEFKKAWQIWKDYKKDEHKFKYKSDHSEKHALAKLNNLADGDIDTALKIIHTSIANGWKGFFALEVEPTNGDEPSMAEQMMKEMKEYRKKQQHEQGN